MSSASLAARLLRRVTTSSSLSALAHRCAHSSAPSRPPVPLPRFHADAAASSSSSVTTHRFLASQSPASSFKISADENLRWVIDSEIDCVVQSENGASAQATLGNYDHIGWSMLEGNSSDKRSVRLCALNPTSAPMCQLELDLEDENVVFSVLGQSPIHLSGYYICSHNGDHGRNSEKPNVKAEKSTCLKKKHQEISENRKYKTPRIQETLTDQIMLQQDVHNSTLDERTSQNSDHVCNSERNTHGKDIDNGNAKNDGMLPPSRIQNEDAEDDLNEDGDDGNENNEESFKPAIQMVVTVEKPEGPILEFNCNFNDDELAIENMRMLNHDNLDAENVYAGPPFSILDDSLQKALHRYLEVRGVKHSLHDWLYEYTMSKDEEYVVWLKNVKEFIGN